MRDDDIIEKPISRMRYLYRTVLVIVVTLVTIPIIVITYNKLSTVYKFLFDTSTDKVKYERKALEVENMKSVLKDVKDREEIIDKTAELDKKLVHKDIKTNTKLDVETDKLISLVDRNESKTIPPMSEESMTALIISKSSSIDTDKDSELKTLKSADVNSSEEDRNITISSKRYKQLGRNNYNLIHRLYLQVKGI